MTKDKTVTMSRELAERINNLVGDFFGSEPEFHELRSLLAKSDLADHCKQCADTVQTWPESKRDCLGKIAAPVVERQYKQYTTQPAESLAGMAARQLKDEGRWIEIRDANALEFPDMAPHDYYPVGSVIRIPCASPPAPVAAVTREQVEIIAESIYWQWAGREGFVPWVKGGNSLKQDEARSIAWSTLDKVKELNQ